MTSELARQASWPDKRAGHFFALYTFFSQLIHHNTKNQLKSIIAIYISHFFIISTNMHVVAGLVAVAIISHYRPIPGSTIIICNVVHKRPAHTSDLRIFPHNASFYLSYATIPQQYNANTHY